ncbi:MAG: NAD(+) kinase [Pseudomonadota bacterium]
MSQFSKIGIISKPDDPAIAATVQSLYQYLLGQSVEIYAEKVSAEFLTTESVKSFNLDDIASLCELVIVVGGDGTILHAGHSLITKEIPLLGINLGRLGFLAEITPKEIEKQLDQILAGEYKESRRMVLKASMIRNGKSIASCSAINDVVVHAKQMVRMIEIESRVNDQYVNTLRADGYIVATPTGSTAYALSGGGPILHPQINAIVLVPICPHTLSNRPIVVDAESRVEILLSEQNRHTALASIDGQIDMDFMPGDTIVIEKSEHVLRLIQPMNYDYFDVLRVKLRWSTSPDTKQ